MKFSSSNQVTPGPGFLISPTLPRGGPQISLSKTFFAASGASSNFFNVNFAMEAGPRPAISLPNTSRTELGNLMPSSDG